MVGFPSVGKSTLLNKLTGTFSEVAAYEFTTLTAVPGIIRYKGAKMQLLDLPGIIEGAKDGKGRGRQVFLFFCFFVFLFFFFCFLFFFFCFLFFLKGENRSFFFPFKWATYSFFFPRLLQLLELVI